MAQKRCAVVPGGNKGIGFEICRQLASEGIIVVLTARDEKKGSEALQKLKHSGLSSENLVFHQLDVMDTASIAILVDFIKASFGKLDILVNNAGIGGLILEGDILLVKEVIEGDAVRVSLPDYRELQELPERKANGRVIETQKSQEQCLQTNYYGAKRMIEAFLPLMKLSSSPRIVNVASFLGKLELLSNEWAKGVLSDAENLTEERVEEVLNQFLDDFKDKVQAKSWPTEFIAYKVSKAALNAYTRIIAKKYPNFRINSVCPGYVKTDVNANTGTLTAAEGAESIVKLALLPDDGPSGLFFFRKEVTTF